MISMLIAAGFLFLAPGETGGTDPAKVAKGDAVKLLFDRGADAELVVTPKAPPRNLLDTWHRLGAKVVLDASGKALVEGVKAHPDVIKPNAEECEALIGFVPKTPEEFKRATAALKAFCDYPIISDGGAGCWFDGLFVPAPKVKVLDTTAAGDTLLAEWCYSGDVRMAVAAGSASCTMPGGEPPDVALVELLVQKI